MAKLLAVLSVLAAVGHNAAQDCVRANSDGGDTLPSFSDPGRDAPHIEVNPVQAIIKSYEFHCCGKVGGWAAIVLPGGGMHDEGVYSIKFQIWRPSGNNRYVKIGENSFPLLALAFARRVEEVVSNSEQLEFQPGDVVGYYLEDNNDQDGGVQFDSSFNIEELWYATGNSALQDECLLEVGSAGDLSMSTNLGPIISISLTTTVNNCPSTFTSTMFCPTPTVIPGTSETTVLSSPFAPSSAPLINAIAHSSLTTLPAQASSTPPVAVISPVSPSSALLLTSLSGCNNCPRSTPILVSAVTTSSQPSPTMIVTPTQSSAGTNLGLYVGVSAGLLVLVLLTVTLVGLGLLTRRRRSKAPHGGIGLVSYKNAHTNVSIIPDENTEPFTKRNEAYGELTKSTISDYDYATNPLAVTSDPSTTTRNPAYGGVTREEEVVYAYIKSDDKGKEIKQCEETEEPSYDPVVGQNPAYGDIVKAPDDEYYYINEGLNDKETKTDHIDGDKQLQSDPVVDQNAAYGAVEGVGFTTDPPIPTRENQAYLSVNNDSELMDVYDYVRQ